MDRVSYLIGKMNQRKVKLDQNCEVNFFKVEHIIPKFNLIKSIFLADGESNVHGGTRFQIFTP